MSASGHLAWRCRRGTKELDVLLERYMRLGYPQAGTAERHAFSRILDLPDPLLSDYLFGHAAAEEPDIAQLIERIAAHRD